MCSCSNKRTADGEATSYAHSSSSPSPPPVQPQHIMSPKSQAVAERCRSSASMSQEEDIPKFLTMTQENPFREDSKGESSSVVRVERNIQAENKKEAGASVSVVSSVSCDSARRYAPIPKQDPVRKNDAVVDPPVPKLIVIPLICASRIVPEWLETEPHTPVLPPSLEAQGGQGARGSLLVRKHNIPRPSVVGRGVSASARLGTSPGSVSLFRDSSNSTSSSNSCQKDNHNSVTDALLGNRPRRKHHRVPSHSLSIGSLVGQSSFLTEPTTASSSRSPSQDGATPSKAGGTRSHRGSRLLRPPLLSSRSSSRVNKLEPTEENSAFTRTKCRNPVKREMLYVLGRVTQPVKNLVRSGSMETQYDLRRSNGCLA